MRIVADMSKKSDEIRVSWKKGDDLRDMGLETPAEIVRYDDIQYGADTKWQVLDVYRPAFKEGEVLPVILSVHGGAWVYGDKERYQYYCMSLAKNGFAVVNFTYRLAPEFQFPSPIEDTNSVIKWIFQNAEKYKLDTDNIFAVGDSVGANSLSIYCAICSSPDFSENFDFKPPSDFRLRAIALNCGLYMLDKAFNPDLDLWMLLSDYFGHDGIESKLKLINVLPYINSYFPPSFVMTCNGDFLKEQAPLMAGALVEANVPFIYRFYGEPGRKLEHVFHVNIKLEEAEVANKEECEFFRNYIV